MDQTKRSGDATSNDRFEVSLSRPTTTNRRSRVSNALYLGLTAILGYLILGPSTIITHRAYFDKQAQKEISDMTLVSQPTATIFIVLTPSTSVPTGTTPSPTSSTNPILRRDTDSNGQATITDSDGTWILVTDQGYTDSNGETWIAATEDQPSHQTTSTTTETVSLTDRVVVSWKTRTETLDHFITITVTNKGTPQQSSNTDKTSSGPKTPQLPSQTTNQPQRSTHTSSFTISSSSPHLSSTTPLSYSPHLSAPLLPLSSSSSPSTICPWSSCPAKPTLMSLPLCQMVNPCWQDAPGHVDRPPSQGGQCACLCESEYCDGDDKLSCPEWNCCHECGCLADNLPGLQRGKKGC